MSTFAQNAQEAAAMMRRTGGYFLKPEKIDSVIESAKNTLDVPPTVQEVVVLKCIAGSVLDLTRRQTPARFVVSAGHAPDQFQVIGLLFGSAKKHFADFTGFVSPVIGDN